MRNVTFKTVAAVLSAVMFMQCMAPATVALAATNERRAASQSTTEGAVGVSGQTTESFDITNEDGSISSITIIENDLLRIVTVLDHQTGETNRIVCYKASGQLYSSYTGETIFAGAASTSVDADTQAVQTTYTTFRFSWSDIRAIVGTTADAGALAATIAALTGVGSVEATYVGVIASALALFSNFIPDDKYHGLAVRVRTTVYRRVPYRGSNMITDIWTY